MFLRAFLLCLLAGSAFAAERCRPVSPRDLASRLFDVAPAEAAAQCAAELSAGAVTPVAVECLLLLHDVAGIVPPLDDPARVSIESLARDTSDVPSPGSDRPLVAGALEVLALADPDRAGRLSAELLRPPSSPVAMARGVVALARVRHAEADALLNLALVSMQKDVRRRAAGVVAQRASHDSAHFVLPLVADADVTLASAVIEGFAAAPAPEAGVLAMVWNRLPRERRGAFAEHLARRAEPRRGRRPVQDAALGEALWRASIESCEQDPEGAAVFLLASRRVGEPTSAGAPVCEAAGWQRVQFLSEAAQGRGQASELLDPVERALSVFPRKKAVALDEAVLDARRRFSAIEAVRWGGSPHEARALRTLLPKLLSESTGCAAVRTLEQVFVAVSAAQTR